MCWFFKKKKDKNKMEEQEMALRNEDYYNNKWPKAPIIYSGRALRGKRERIGVDVKNFISINDEIINDIVKKYSLQKRTHDDTALAVQKWVVRFLTYKYDDELNLTPEFWQFPFETLQSQHGDCEDGGILIAALCIAAGIPGWRVKVAAGYVQSAPTAPQGGHAYCIYLADDGEWRILDWCYYEDSNTPVKAKPLAKNGGQRNAYKDVWFTFNNEYSWNQKSLTVGSRMANDTGEKSDNTLQEVITNEIKLEDIMESVDKKVGVFEG